MGIPTAARRPRTQPDFVTVVTAALAERELDARWLVLELTDGSRVRILENAGNGAVVLATVIADDEDPDRVGQEEIVLFHDVERVVEEDAS